MYAVNELINDAYEGLNLTGLGEATEGDPSVVGLKELNSLISQLNGQGFISLTQKFVDSHSRTFVDFKVLTDEERAEPPANVIDMAPPSSIDAVGRKVGMHYIPMSSADMVQMSTKNPASIASGWNYGRHFEPVPGAENGEQREVGHLQLDGICMNGFRIFYTSALPKYKLDQTIYLPDLYNELLLTGLKVKLVDFFKLYDGKTDVKADREFKAAKKLIKRENVTQRMLRDGGIGGDYNDDYYNAFCPAQWG